MAHIDPNVVGRMPPEDRPVHVGKHHREFCGEWRPVTNEPCPACADRCPECGSFLRRPTEAWD